MQTEPLFKLPNRLAALVDRAHAADYRTYITWAESEGEQSVCIRFRHLLSYKRTYGIWIAGTTARGALSVKWLGGASNDMRYLPTVAALTGYLFPHDTESDDPGVSGE